MNGKLPRKIQVLQEVVVSPCLAQHCSLQIRAELIQGGWAARTDAEHLPRDGLLAAESWPNSNKQCLALLFYFTLCLFRIRESSFNAHEIKESNELVRI